MMIKMQITKSFWIFFPSNFLKLGEKRQGHVEKIPPIQYYFQNGLLNLPLCVSSIPFEGHVYLVGCYCICLFGLGKAKANPRQQRRVKRRGYQTLDGISNKLVVPYGTSWFCLAHGYQHKLPHSEGLMPLFLTKNK